jgi:AcrR family transcriptional regulator
MPRWDPDARERLVVAALQLFSEQGNDETTVAVIADRADLTKNTFHRHFADKRDVLAAGQETLSRDPDRIRRGVAPRCVAEGLMPVRILPRHVMCHQRGR